MSTKKGKGILAGTGASMFCCCIVLLIVVVGGFIVTQYMIQPNDNGDGDGNGDTQPIGIDTGTDQITPITTEPTDTTTNPILHYRLTWGFTWNDFLAPEGKVDITITLHDADNPLYIFGSLTLGKDVGDAPLVYYPIVAEFLAGARVMVRISNDEDFEFIIFGLATDFYYTSADPSSANHPIGCMGLAEPIEVGNYFSTWEPV